MGKIVKIILASLITSVMIIVGVAYWHYLKLHPTTDDAYVNANVVAIAAQIRGPIDEIYTQNYAQVKQGELLFTIDPRPFQIAVQKAAANLANIHQAIATDAAAVNAARAKVKQRRAELTLAEKNTPRVLTLVKKQAASKADGDKAQRNLDVARANLKSAQSELKEAIATLGAPGENNAQIRVAKATLARDKLNLSYTHIYAPADGYITNFELRRGTMVTAEQPLFSLVESKEWWIDTNFKETKLARIRPGQSATITIDSYPNHKFKGIVESINSGSGAAFSIMPPENATGNWVKVTQRFTVKVKILRPNLKYPLRVGASSTVTIDTTK